MEVILARSWIVIPTVSVILLFDVLMCIVKEFIGVKYTPFTNI